jgi:alkanesulfonate monooxygenase SsuD/methylene tetrahydromethanopterin reductase-like flavin-dependent oxidoreductase (luciferase family)
MSNTKSNETTQPTGITLPKPGFGINLTSTIQGDQLVAEAQHAESLGFDLVTVHPDHPSAAGRNQEPSLETWTALSWLAAKTSTIKVAPSVLSLPYRHPAVIAKMVETLDRLSGSRFILAMGGGGDDLAFQSFGLTPRSAAEKVKSTEEAIDIIQGLWRESSFSYEGQHFTLVEANIAPRPVHQIPLWLGAYGPHMLNLTGRKADGWLSTLPYLVHGMNRDTQSLYGMLQQIRKGASAEGRDPAKLTYACNVAVQVQDGIHSRPGMIAGSPSEVAAKLAELLRNGFTFLNFFVSGDASEQHERLAKEVIPEVRNLIA